MNELASCSESGSPWQLLWVGMGEVTAPQLTNQAPSFCRSRIYCALLGVSVYLPRIGVCFPFHLVAGTEQILKIQVHSRNVGDVE